MKVLLCAIVKNENRYINEWIDHYKKLGFSKIILYDNNDVNGEHIQHNFGNYVKIIDYRGQHISVNESNSIKNHVVQSKAYTECYKKYAKDYDWVAYFDIDEFLYIDNNLTINQFLEQDKFTKADAIQINWKIYGDNDKLYYENTPVQQRFTTISQKQTSHIKTLLRTNNPNFISMQCHQVVLSHGLFLYPSGEKTICGYKQEIDYTGAHIKHYYTKSIEEWIDRKNNTTSATGQDYLNNTNRRITEFFIHNSMTPQKMIVVGNKLEIEKDNSKKVLPVIISLYSSKNEFEQLPIIIRSIYKNSCIPSKIIVNIFQDDALFLTDKLKKLEKNGFIEIKKYHTDIKQHLKYFPTMLAYKDMPIIVIDNNVIYSQNLIESLYNEYLSNPKCIISRYVRQIKSIDNNNYKIEKNENIKEYVKSKYLCADSKCGTLYPPNILDFSENDLLEIKNGFIDYPEIYLKNREFQNDIEIIHIPNNGESMYFDEYFNINEIQQNKKLQVALCAIAKNENLYIREWVEWYKKLGIAKIFLYDNNEIDGERFEEVINDYIESGFVKIIDRRGIEKGCVYDENGINLQPKSYIEFYEGEGKNFDWICFFDVDEFLTFKNSFTLNRFLNQDKFKDTDLILVSWQHYDDNNLLTYENKHVMKRFKHESKWYRHGVKSIVRTNKIINDKQQGNLIHIFRLSGNRTKYSTGIEIRDEKTWYVIPHGEHLNAPCQLNHYKTKTAHEYIKRHLGRHWGTGKNYTEHAKNITDCINDFFNYNEESIEKLNIFKKYSFDKEYIKNELIEYGKTINMPINLDKPKTYQDKINWMKIYDSTDLKTLCADKIKVHEYSLEKLDKDICIPIKKIYNNLYEFIIDWENIPNNCVIKCNHGSGYMIICDDKSKLNKDECIKKLNEWMHTDYGLDHYGYQIHYSKIKPKIFIEPLMKNDESDKLLINYKFHCFNGKPKIIEIYQSDGPSNDTQERINFYDLDFNLLNISQFHHDNDPNRKDSKPHNYKKMINYAKILSKDFCYVRVDFYEINDCVYLGELTFTPNNGFVKFNDDNVYHTSEYLGNLIELNYEHNSK